VLAGDDVPKAVFSSYAGIVTTAPANGSEPGTEAAGAEGSDAAAYVYALGPSSGMSGVQRRLRVRWYWHSHVHYCSASVAAARLLHTATDWVPCIVLHAPAIRCSSLHLMAPHMPVHGRLRVVAHRQVAHPAGMATPPECCSLSTTPPRLAPATQHQVNSLPPLRPCAGSRRQQRQLPGSCTWARG
jgi:hypothetical protein